MNFMIKKYKIYSNYKSKKKLLENKNKNKFKEEKDIKLKKNIMIILEIGFGKGCNLIKTSNKYKKFYLLGLEKYNNKINRIFFKIKKNLKKKIKINHNNAKYSLENGIYKNSLSGTQIFFPDPWDKKKHTKKKIINYELIEKITNKMQNKGFIQLSTDSTKYSEKNILLLKKT